ncbi:MAG: PIN domain-containing protein [Acidimicrobiales bacterium]
MTLLDAYALVAWLAGEPAQAEVRALLDRAPVVSAVNIAETVDQMGRIRGIDCRPDLDVLVRRGLDVVPFTDVLARSAGSLRARHYHRTRRAVSLGDCAAAATALARGIAVATPDPGLAAVVRVEGGHVVALPDSRGRRP